MDSINSHSMVASKSNGLNSGEKNGGLQLVSDFDELEHQLRRHRDELQAIDLQIAKLEEAIDVDQARSKELKDAMASKVRTRSRLITVRSAMSKFIQGLQLRDAL